MDRNRTDEYVLTHFISRDDEICIPYHQRGTSTKPLCRPDFLLWLGDVLLFWGEEKAVSGAKEDLQRKFKVIDPVVFGDIQFMICYALNGSKIRFYAVDGSPQALK